MTYRVYGWLILCVLIYVGSAQAQVALPFSSTFDCPESNQSSWGSTISGCPGWQLWSGATTANGSRTRISSSDNNPGGGGGRGYGKAVGYGGNNNGGSIRVTFAPQQQLWVRFYARWPLGFSWANGQPQYVKILRFNGTNLDFGLQFYDSHDQSGSFSFGLGTTSIGPWQHLGGSCGWVCIMGGNLGSGQWNAYEAHIKAGNPGMIQGWINGNLVFSHAVPVDLGSGATQIEIHGNQNFVTTATDSYVSYDDIVISNTGYIGPISGGGDTTPPVISSPLPSGEQAYGTTSVTLQVTTDEAATCKYHTSDVAYASMSNTFGSTGGTTHQQTGFATANGQSYTRYVRCVDGTGNASAASTVINFSVAASAPTISSVSGTVQTGQTLTVVGNSLNDEAKSNWDSFFVNNPNAWSFEGSTPSADGYGGIGPSGGAYDTSVKILGNKSMRFSAQGASSNCPTGNLANYNAINPAGGDANEYWVRGYVRWNASGGWPSSHIKMIDIQGSGAQYYLQPSSTTNNLLPLQMNAIYDGAGHFVNIPSGRLENNRWYALEIHWKTSSAPYVFDVWLDGTKIVTANPSAQGSMNYLLFGLVNLCGTSSGFSVDHWWDGFAVATSRIYPSAVVEIGDSPNYATATKKYQAPLFISDGEVQVTADLTGLGSGPYYLWVTNNRQERSSAYNLSGGGGDTTPPVISNPLPSGEQAYGTTSVTLQVTTNEAATCRYHTSDVAYASMGSTFGSTGGTTHRQTGFSVVNGQSYTRYVRCIDGTGNANTASTAINFSVAASAPTADLLFSESFENTSWSARGWYDSATQGSIVSGGQSGNALQWAWSSGATKPTNGNAIRNTFAATDEMYVSVYMKYASTWRGSQQTYHPHMILFPSTLDSSYSALANNYLNTYIEAVSDVGSPYIIRPVLALQDSLRVNTSFGTPPNNITATTENRSVNHCNGYLSGQDSGTLQVCYSTGGGSWYSATAWKGSSTVIPKDQWVKVDTHFKMNTIVGGIAQPDGIMRQWIDGVLWLDKSNIVYRTNQDATKRWDKVVLAPYIGDGSPITQTMWIDELRIYDGVPWGDTTPPSIPTSLTATAVSVSQINLSWTASTDDTGIAGYDIRRCSGSGCTPSSIVHNTTGTGTTWNNTGLSASTIYRYDVRARDAVPNYSNYSTIAQATTQTPPDTTPPSVIITTTDPTRIHISSLTVTGTSSDAVGVSGCKWRRTLAPNASNGTLCTGTTSFSCATSGYSQGANTLYVGCYDAAGNYGSDSMVVNYYPPLSAPTNLRIY